MDQSPFHAPDLPPIEREPLAATRPLAAPSEAYAAPALAVFGRAGDLTMAVGRRGKKDSKRGTRRTGF